MRTVTRVRVQFDRHLAETLNAYLFKIGTKEYWLPKKLCSGLVVNKKLGGNVSIPSWLYKEKFGEEPLDEIAEITVVHHVPEKIDAVKTEADDSLIK